MTRLLSITIVFLGALLVQPSAAQDSFRDVVELTIAAGFNGYFRPDDWTPVRVAMTNNGESLRGRLVVRPETSGTVVGNAFSTPVELPSGAQKTATLNIQARTYPDQIRVELIDAAGNVRASRDAPLFDLQRGDQLYAVVTGANTIAPSLTGVHIGGYRAEQAIWSPRNLPERAQSLASLDMLMLLNVDSERLSPGQRGAIEQWVADGGHLLVGGGPSAAATASALGDLLPLLPQEAQSMDDLNELARYAGDRQVELRGPAIVARGQLAGGATVLVEQAGIPLLVRRAFGAGLVDFLAADPSLAPLARWDGLSELWRKLLLARPPQPSWRNGFTQSTWGAEAVANLPGFDLLPPLQTLCLFLALYILLIGPLNYALLARLGRPGWGWMTIPLVIVIFTLLAWTVGFNLRGAEVIVSRLTVVEAYADHAEARLRQVIGLLSPRRATYSLSLPEGSFLAVAGATAPTSIFASNTIQTATEIAQGARFSADQFTIDGGIFANFSASGRVAKPDIGGSFTLSFDITESGRMQPTFQGAVSNRSQVTLRDAVIVGAGFSHALENDFAPGAIVPLGRDELRADLGDRPAQPNPLELNVSALYGQQSPFTGSDQNISIKDLQGARYLRTRAFLSAESLRERQLAREQSFLASFMRDEFASTARGTGLYLLGWSDAWARDLEIEGAGWSSVDTTLYIIELAVDIALPERRATLTTEHFSWMTLDRQGIADNGTDNFSLYEDGAVTFLFQPLPGLAMRQVERMQVEVDRGGGFTQALELHLYNWERGEYEVFGYRDGKTLELTEPAPYLGPSQTLRLRLQHGGGIGTVRVRDIRLAQTGRY
ncbi:MAG: hypothetical protein OXE95_10850 [Chloroflexi bacterium]|nr:hypothetical protein [Chloroflexota bacterium]MCY4248055.1 hypothetical protein [Chloroflexota bacterium]